LPSNEQPRQQSSGAATTGENQTQNIDWNNWTRDPVAVFTGVLTSFNGLLFLSTVGLWLANRRSAKIAERALTELERAFVFIDGFSPEITTAVDLDTPLAELPERYRSNPHLYMHRFAVVPRWKNGGNTPTRHMTIRVNWRGPPGPIPPDYVYGNSAEPFFLAPRAVESSTLIEMPGAAILIDWALRPIGVEPLVFIWGRGDYEDAFRRKHFIEWCYRLRFESYDGQNLRAHFIQWGDYNRTDDSPETS
jgi:hypothetical protein